MSYVIHLPKTIHVGKGAINQLITVLDSLSASHPLIVADTMMVKLGYTKLIEDILHKKSIKYAIYADTVPEPTDISIAKGIELVTQKNFDAIIAIGGGSVIDSAKAISIVGKFGGKISDYKFPYNIKEYGLPLIAIPTTAGTGSEATQATVITNTKRNEKILCMGPGLMPIAALIDYELTISAPPRVTADSGLDALTHAIEAYVSRKANYFSDIQALAAMKLIANNLRIAYQQPNNEAAREAMLLGSHLAGIAFTNSSVALVHGMSRPIGAHFHVPHGLSNAMLLPTITEFNIPSSVERYATCAKETGMADYNDSDTVACEKLIQGLIALNRDLQVPTLKDLNINVIEYEALLPVMAEQAIASGSPANNPRVPSIVEIVELYRKVYD